MRLQYEVCHFPFMEYVISNKFRFRLNEIEKRISTENSHKSTACDISEKTKNFAY